MTNKEAIEKIINTPLMRMPNEHGELKEALQLAIESLQKQIPKNPFLEGDGYANGELVYDTWYCPYCDTSYEVDYDDYDFCPSCGQAIDWSEEE